MKRISTESFKTCMKRVIRLKRVPMDRGSSLWMWPEDPTIAQGGARWMPTTGAYQNKTWDQTWVATS